MANAAAKRQAAANVRELNKLHLISVSVFVTSLLLNVLRGRNVRSLFLMSSFELATEYIIEKNSRPKFVDGQLVNPGGDINQSGLTEYMFDVIYMSWICQTVSIFFGSRAWWLFWLVPVFLAYKAVTLLFAGRKLLTGMGGGQDPGAGPREEPGLSKRQEKLRKRNKQ